MPDNIRKFSATSPTPAPNGIATLSTLKDDSVSETLTTLLERKGKFQCIVILLLSLNSISIGINHTVTAFHIYVSDFFCKDNPTEQCGVYVNGTECPSGYIFNKQDDHSVAVEWSLVCNQRMLAPLANTIYFIGVTLGALICSGLCDIWGRKKLVLICMYAQAVMGFGQYVSRSFVMFCFFRLLQGFFIQGMQTCSYTLMLEYCPSRYRTKAAIIWELNWTVGLGLLSITTYFITEWRLLTLVLTLPAVFSLSYSWIFPESITWLFAKGYNKEVLEQVHKIANFNKSYDIVQRCNGFDLEAKNKEDNQSTIEQNSEKTTKLSAIVRSTVLRKHLFSMIFIWFSVTLSYYGVLFFLPNLAGERHLNFFLGALAEMIAYILAYFVLSRFGRRMPLAFYQYANGTLLLLIGLITTIPDETQIKVSVTIQITKTSFTTLDVVSFYINFICVVTIFVSICTSVEKKWPFLHPTIRELMWALIIITLIAKGFAVSSFCSMFIYGSELFPTVCRGFGLGLCGFAARCGSLLAPQLLALNYFVPEYVPLLIMAVFLLSAASVTLILPETLLSNLPNTAEEAEEMWALKK